MKLLNQLLQVTNIKYIDSSQGTIKFWALKLCFTFALSFSLILSWT